MKNPQEEKNISVEIRSHPKAKCFRLSVFPEGRVLLTYPKWERKWRARKFLKEKEGWIREQLKKTQGKRAVSYEKKRKEYLRHKEEARTYVYARLRHVNRYYGFLYARVSIRNQKTRWGSCSEKGNLNFHYKLLFLPEKYADYIIAHELCHLKEMNHSRAFWKLVEQAIPEYRDIKKALREYGPDALS